MELEMEFDFTIIGIKTILEDYLLAFYLNKELGTYFERCENDIDVIEEEVEKEEELNFFSHFIFNNIEEMEEWHLISNRYYTEIPLSIEREESQDLFSLNKQTIQVTKYFIPEKKEVEYLLRIDSIEDKSRLNELINKIRSIQAITTAYLIEYNTLRSKRNLIF
jgi:hypothetical protein